MQYDSDHTSGASAAHLLHNSVLIVGAGHSGVATAAALRQSGYVGPITLIGEESEVPYHRPPVSKTYLNNDPKIDYLRPPAFYTDNNVEFIPERSVVRVDVDTKSVQLDNMCVRTYDQLVYAAGARPRTLPDLPANGCWTLRNYDDAIRFKDVLISGARIVIVGGGFIGLEVAAAARRHGCDVTVLERESTLLARLASPTLAEMVLHHHREQGVEIRLGSIVAGIQASSDDSVSAVLLDNGERIPCEAVVLGIGAVPRVELLRDVGAHCEGGIVVDTECRTNLPSIYAVGDVTQRAVSGYPGSFRLESIANANDQAKQVAAAITGSPAPTSEVPWFWSDQYDLNIKIAGLLVGVEQTILRGDPGSRTFAVFHLAHDGRVVTVETVNAAAEFAAGKKWIRSGEKPDPMLLHDTNVSLRSTLRSPTTV